MTYVDGCMPRVEARRLSRRQRLYLRAGGSAVSAAVCVFVPITAIATLFALPLVLYFPGSAVLEAVEPPDLSNSRGLRVFWATTTSLVLVVFGILVLNEVASITRANVAVTLLAITLGGSGVSYLKMGWTSSSPGRFKHSQANEAIDGDDTPRGTGDPADRNRLGGGTVRMACLFGLAVALLAAALVVSQQSIASTNSKSLQIWLTPSPVSAGPAAHHAQVGVRNDQGAAVSVIVRLMESGGAVDTWDVRLSVGQAWSMTVPRPTALLLVATVAYSAAPGHVIQNAYLRPKAQSS
jgi:hypothetical protein